jgi:hypothetical protein
MFVYFEKVAVIEDAALDQADYSVQIIGLNCVRMLIAAKLKYKAVCFLSVFGGMSEVQTDFFKS